ncbi:unnamed protein product [Nezara viridula]|uniref:NadR/Ttd14 AAA domain-containing protein n=1 Tax=Nezara viridula TaxID=85310 RepID=A0A9P0HPA2_NEZVI|nr:unnamed protein product [Nezara viridula]
MDSKEKRVYKIVLTGGPCGGKTTGQARLSTFFENLGWKVFRVPETATVLLSGGIKFSDLNADQGDDTHTCARCVGVRTKELTSFSEGELLVAQ